MADFKAEEFRELLLEKAEKQEPEVLNKNPASRGIFVFVKFQI
jgi:hypothetical protein